MASRVRLNRSGIPVLDPPGRNFLPKSCPPREHDWGPPREIKREWFGTWYEPGVEVTYEQTCRHCGVRDTYSRSE